MPRIIVEVMPKRARPDAHGEVITGVLQRIGFEEFAAVRQGKRFELTVSGALTPEVLGRGREVAQEILANPVTEEVTAVFAAEDGAGA